jgi:Leucine-rich repeat (LRR) protein
LKQLPQPPSWEDVRRTWQQLETLLLAANLFDACPPHVALCGALRVLDLGRNSLTEWPDALLHLSNLEELSLSHNDLATGENQFRVHWRLTLH